MKNKKSVILDARSKEEFNGSDVRAARRGHIPSAVNIDWQNNIENGIFKEIRKNLSKIYSKIPKNVEYNNILSRWIQGREYICCLENVGVQEGKDVSWFMGRMGKECRSACFRCKLMFLISNFFVVEKLDRLFVQNQIYFRNYSFTVAS